MAVHAEALELQLLSSGSDAARRRFAHLRRRLFIADAITGVVSGGLVGAVAHASAPKKAPAAGRSTCIATSSPNSGHEMARQVSTSLGASLTPLDHARRSSRA